jgi:competence protein ComFC
VENFYEKILNLFFPKKCINCQKYGDFLCYDCLSLIEIMQKTYNLPENIQYLDKLFFATNFKDPIVKKLIYAFKYPPFIKGLSNILSDIIITHLTFMKTNLDNFLIAPIPISKKRMNYRGYNQSEELAKQLSLKLKLDHRNILEKVRETKSQIELGKEERENNIKDAFSVKDDVKDKNILLVDDVFTTGSTIDEASRVAKQNGAKQVWAVVVARE